MTHLLLHIFILMLFMRKIIQKFSDMTIKTLFIDSSKLKDTLKRTTKILHGMKGFWQMHRTKNSLVGSMLSDVVPASKLTST